MSQSAVSQSDRRTLPPKLRSTLLALVAGLCIAASVPPWGWWPLAFVGVALWDRLLAGASPRARFARSWLMGLAWFAPSMLWMANLTAVGFPIAIILYAGYLGVAGLLVPGRSSKPWVRWVSIPAAFTIAEVSRWTFPFGGVPLATTAMSQAAAPLGQIARVFCALGVVFFVGVCGVALSMAWARRWRVAGTMFALTVIVWALAMIAPRGHDIRSIDAAIVQGGGPQGTRATETDPNDVFMRHLDATQLVTVPVDLVLWPENVVDVEGPITANPENAILSDLAQTLDTTLVVGVTEGVDSHTFINESIVYLPDGSIGDRYEKVRRVPFGEYVPARDLLESIAGNNSGLPLRDARAGTEPAVLETPLGNLAIAISWEIFFTNRGRDGVLNGGEILLNPTNGSSYWLTEVQTQQVASSQLRAIETGRWVLQAAPTGFSAIVTPSGRVEQRSSISEQRVLQQAVFLRSGDTIATRIGPMPIALLSLALLGIAWFSVLVRPRLRARARGRDDDLPTSP
ncbi:Lnt Apolipoprotein N-acyltransferase [Acidimicrobiia bacterium]